MLCDRPELHLDDSLVTKAGLSVRDVALTISTLTAWQLQFHVTVQKCRLEIWRCDTFPNKRRRSFFYRLLSGNKTGHVVAPKALLVQQQRFLACCLPVTHLPVKSPPVVDALS